MKNLLLKGRLCLIILLLSSWRLAACDACGCSLNGMNGGLLSPYGQHYIGLWWQHQQYRSIADPNSILDQAYPNSEEQFQVLNLRLGWQLSRRWQILLDQPYSFQTRQSEATIIQQNGWGDSRISALYSLFNNLDSARMGWRHQLRLGSGLELPTGQDQQLTENGLANANFRLGSGTWDSQAQIAYTLQNRNWGIHTELMYQWLGSRSDDYQYGNPWQGSISLYRNNRLGASQLLTRLGLYTESAQMDADQGYYLPHTGGSFLFGQAGAELYWNRFALGVQTQIPIVQDWGNGLVQCQTRIAFQAMIFF